MVFESDNKIAKKASRRGVEKMLSILTWIVNEAGEADQPDLTIFTVIEKQDKNLLPPDLFSRNTVISHLAGMIFPEAGIKVLDVGGRGARLNWFMPESANYTILDLAPKAEDEECEYRQGDVQKIPFSDRNFDLVVSTDMLEHVDKPFRAPAIREMLRVSKNHLILGVPCGNGLITKAEEIINRQYREVSGHEHPFLNEHLFYGLPGEEKIEEILNREGVKFFKVKEGNLMSWYINQLYTGVLNGQDMENSRYEFYKFFNDNLFELGNLRTPTYRTIFVIAKEGELPEQAVIEDLNAKHVWNPEKFMDLLEKAFADIRLTIEEKMKHLQLVESTYTAEKGQFEALQGALNDLRKEYEDIHARSERNVRALVEKDARITELEVILTKAKESLNGFREAVKEARAVLQEKEQAINLFRKAVAEKDEIIVEFRENEKRILELLNREILINQKNTADLSEKEGIIFGLKNRLEESGNLNLEKDNVISARENELVALRGDLENHQKALREVINSRAWKTVMRYSRVKTKFAGIGGAVAGAGKTAVKGWKILTKLGPATFIKRLAGKIKKNPVPEKGLTAYDVYIEKNENDYRGRGGAIKDIENYIYKPVISVVMPVFNVEEKWLRKAIESVRKQWYPRWELCVCNDASTDEKLKDVLNYYVRLDNRIKIVNRQHNGGIVKATNDALKLATGAYVTFLDNDDELGENALYEVIKSLQETRYDLVYGDEDKIDAEGVRGEPFFKPDWSPDLLMSHNYICHPAVYKRKIVEEIGRLREGFDGSQDYDLLLRFTEKNQNIGHIPKILYHWRRIPGSAALEVEAKPYAFDSAKKALRQALGRRGIKGSVEDGIWKGSYRVRREIIGEPLVSIIIPFKDQARVLKKCVDSILEKSTWKNYEILLVNNLSEEAETREYMDSLGSEKIVPLEYNEPFNFSSINNYAAGKANGDYMILINNDTEVIEPGWIEAMLEHAQRKEVGAVGAKLLFPNELVQHAGILVGVGGIANSSFLKSGGFEHGYFGQANVIRNYSAITGACMMVRKDIYFGVGGLNENDLAVTFNDVDFCLRLRAKGYLIVFTPYARLYHHESLSRGYEVSLDEVKYMQREHRSILSDGDPYYNPNLTHERFDFSLRVEDKLV